MYWLRSFEQNITFAGTFEISKVLPGNFFKVDISSIPYLGIFYFIAPNTSNCILSGHEKMVGPKNDRGSDENAVMSRRAMLHMFVY